MSFGTVLRSFVLTFLALLPIGPFAAPAHAGVNASKPSSCFLSPAVADSSGSHLLDATATAERPERAEAELLAVLVRQPGSSVRPSSSGVNLPAIRCEGILRDSLMSGAALGHPILDPGPLAPKVSDISVPIPRSPPFLIG